MERIRDIAVGDEDEPGTITFSGTGSPSVLGTEGDMPSFAVSYYVPTDPALDEDINLG